MKDRNEHHRFEDLCRAVARQRITPNILPATGPVSAGGDQGRDFETFRTYIAAAPDGLRGFCGTGGSDVLVFACTLQSVQGIKRKIRTDVATIVHGGQVDVIFFFTEANIKRRLRGDIQAELLREHGTKVEIIDGNGLAELLNTPETFWIAAQYLDISSAYMPDPEPTGPDSEPKQS